jgi:hypothetical protein
VVIAMSVIVGVAALGIDAATWMVRHHQTQVVADSAALAAANCLANPGSTAGTIIINGGSTNVPACTSGTSTTAARTVAEDYALANGIRLADSQVTFDTTNDYVQVNATATSPAFFGHLFGIGSTSQSAAAQAHWMAGSTPCATAGNSCAAVFAMAQSCANGSGDPGGSPIILNGKNDTITGIVHSNGSIDEVGGGQALGPTAFGNGSGCALNTSGSGDTWNSSSTQPSAGQAPITTWPDDYSTVVTACGSGGTGTCNSSGTPSYCTQSAANFTFGSGNTTPTSGQVWCAYGTGTPSKPSTWNGLIYFQSGATTLTGNWIGGTIDIGSKGWTLNSPASSTFPVLYATGSGDCSTATVGGICMPGQSQTINGALFAPNGWIQFNGAGTLTDDFLEGQYIDFVGGSQNMLGIGPTSLTGGGSGTDSLTQ